MLSTAGQAEDSAKRIEKRKRFILLIIEETALKGEVQPLFEGASSDAEN